MFILGWICLGMHTEYGISFALFYIWVAATTQRIQLGQHRDHFLKKNKTHLNDISEIIYEGTYSFINLKLSSLYHQDTYSIQSFLPCHLKGFTTSFTS